MNDLAVTPGESQASRALEIGGRVLRAISGACVEADRFLFGYRWRLVIAVGVIGMVLGIAHSLDAFGAWPHVLSLVVFVLLLVMLAWARVAVIHHEATDDGWAGALRGALAGLSELLSDDSDDAESSAVQRGAARRRVWTARLFSLSVLVYTVASIASIAPSLAKGAGLFQVGAMVMVAVSVALWLRGTQDDEQASERQKFTTISTEATEAEFLSLPPILELKKSTVSELALVHRSGDELLRELLVQLPGWTPGRCKHEKVYQEKLVRFLRRKLPGIRVDTEVPMTPDNYRNRAVRFGRIDIVLDGRIAIELKRGLENNQNLYRCVGQIETYSSLWRDKGLLFLLVCEYESDFSSSASVESLVGLQQRGTPFRVLVGGHRLPER